MLTTFDQKLAEYLNNWVIDGWPIGNLILVIIALALAVVLCGVIGLERELTGRSAGLRTHLLVGVGSCMLMIISIYGFPAIFGDRDVARLAAQVVTGVGFLGAGAIMHRNSGIKGLTTAGTIWIVMAIGMACGSFNFILAALGTGIIVMVLTVFKRIEAKLSKKTPMIILRAMGGANTLEQIISVSKMFDCIVKVVDVELTNPGEGPSVIEITFQAVFPGNKSDRLLEYIGLLEKQTNALSVQLLSRK